jgi:hypothetical protein
MSLLSEQMRKTYSGNGSTTSFSFPWGFQSDTDLDVWLVDEAGTVLGTAGAEFFQAFVTDYDVIGTYNPLTAQYDDFSSGANVVFVVAPATGYTVVILRNTPDTQDLSLPAGTAYPPQDIEHQFDKLVMMIQYLYDRVKRSIRLTDANPQTFSTELPNPLVADTVIAVNSDASGFTTGPTVTDISGAAASATAAAASAVAAAASATSASSSASAASTSASAASTSASAAAASALAAASSATNASASAVAAAASAASFSNYFGSGGIPETTFTIANNQAVAANVTALLFAGASVRSAEIDAHFYINTTGGGATEMSSRAKYFATYSTVAASWDLTVIGVSGDVDASGNPSGVTLSITSAGQVQYTSGNTTGTGASSVMHFTARTMGV